MNENVSQAALRILDDLPGYLGAMFFFMALALVRRGRIKNTLRERISLSVPKQTATIVVFAGAFIWLHIGDIRLVARARPAWGWYVSVLVISGAAGAIILARNHLRESRTPSKIPNVSAERSTARDRYKQIVVMELKGTLVWVLAAILAVYWLGKIAISHM